ncbi:MAG: PIN domain-containing protein [Nanoarchaeota archaeon]|nr:PIN domain-containing protein [Nanoarchaeota archaeon]
MKSYYADSCIYLNLWKKEVDEYGNKLWEFAKDFFEKAESEEAIIYYSGYLLKELMFVFDENKFIDKLELFNFSPNFKRVNLKKEEYELAKKIKKENIEISFYDIIHMLLAKQTNSVLITRDNLLINLAKEYQVMVKKPEENL